MLPALGAGFALNCLEKLSNVFAASLPTLQSSNRAVRKANVSFGHFRSSAVRVGIKVGIIAGKYVGRIADSHSHVNREPVWSKN